MKKRMLAMILMIAMALSLAACGDVGGTSSGGEDGKKETISLRIGAGHVREGTYWTYALSNYFQPKVAERVANETNYEIEWVEAYGGSVAKLGEELESIEQGLLDIGVVCYAFEPSNLYLNSFTYSIPFTCDDPAIMGEIVREMYEEFPEFNAVFEKYNMINLSVLASDSYDMFSAKPFEKADDLKGMKIGGSNTTLVMLEGTGATGVQNGATEAYTGIQTGVYDAFIGPSYTVATYKVQEVAPYFIQTNLGAQGTASFCMNKDSFDRLPEDVAQIILEVGAEAGVYESEYAKEIYDKHVETLKNTDGVFVSQLSVEEQAAWAAKMPNVVGNLVAELDGMGYDGSAIVDAFLSKLEARGYAPNRDWDY